MKNNVREFSGEPVVTKIELKQNLQVSELLRNSAAKPVGIDVKQCEIREKAKFLREVAGDIAVVEVDAGDGTDRAIIECGCTEDSGVAAHLRSNPVNGEIEWI